MKTLRWRGPAGATSLILACLAGGCGGTPGAGADTMAPRPVAAGEKAQAPPGPAMKDAGETGPAGDAKERRPVRPAAAVNGDNAGPGAEGAAEEELENGQYAIRYRLEAGDYTYYVIENEFVDHGGVPSFGLTFTTTVRDRTSLAQYVVAGPPAESRSGQRTFASVEWYIDRYEVHEKAMKDDHKFDSLRDLYPKAQLRPLGTIPGARVGFSMDPVTGYTTAWRISPGTDAGPRSTRKVSRTVERCLLTNENLQRTLDDLGPLFLPGKPVAVGDCWMSTRSEEMRNAGTAVTDYTFTLLDVRHENNQRIAVIDISGEISLEPAKAGKVAAHQRRKPETQRDFRIVRALCQGLIEFDVDAGRLLKLEMRRGLELSAEVEGKDKLMTMELVTGQAHMLRVEGSDKEPVKPVFVGERKPPVEDPEPVRPNRPPPRRSPPRTTTQPGTPGERPGTRFPTSRPAAVRPGPREVTSRPAPRPVTSQPPSRAKGRASVPSRVQRDARSREGVGQPPRRVRPSPAKRVPTSQPASRPASGE